MTEAYSRLLENLQQRKIELCDYSEYLALSHKGQFEALSQSLTQRNISLPDYLKYLEQMEPRPSSPQNSTPENETADLKNIESVGQLLLQEKQISLKELNHLLESLKIRNLITFLQQLLMLRKIKTDEFVKFLYGKFSLPSESPYHLIAHEDSMKFSLDIKKGQGEYGPYVVLEELGRGGMGVVYKAYHPQLNRMVALKVLLAGNLASEKTQQRFRREIEVMAKLEHEGIVKIYDSGNEGEIIYLAMEYVEGASLSKKMKHLNLQEKVTITQQVLNALHYAHQQGIIHRDLKLDNILITPKNQPKIADFGLAKIMTEEGNEKLTESGVVLGTANYMAPEQARGKVSEIEARSDIYAIGVCLYHLLTQHFPHEEKSLHQLLDRIVHEDAALPSKYVPTLRRDLEAIVLKALEKEKANRYQTAEAFADDLERFLQGHRVEALEKELQLKMRRWIKKHQIRVIVFITVFLVGFVGMFMKIGLGYQERKALYEKKYQAFLIESKNKGFYAKLQSWNYLNEALQVIPNDPLAEAKKWEMGEVLLKEVLQQENRYLGDYVIEEMQQLSTFPETQRLQRKKQWANEKNAYWKQEEQRFEYWISRLSSEEQVGSEEMNNALFEILKMSAPTINSKLLEILQEGNLFFEQENIAQEEKKANYYQWAITVLSRRKVKEALPLICEGLSTLSAQYRKFKIPNDLEKIHSMVKMARYLLGIEASYKADFLYERRVETRENSLFWSRSTFIQKKLYQLKLEVTERSQAVPQTDQEFYQRGLMKYLSGDFKGALNDFSEAICLNPQFATAYTHRGNAKQEKKDLDGAISDYTEAIRLNPQFATAYNNRGNVKYKKKDLEEAISDYTEAIRLNPQDAVAYNNRGTAKTVTKDLNGAIEDYTEAIRLNPQFSEAYTNRGVAKKSKKDLEGAISDYTETIRLNPQYTEAYNNRGSAKQEKKDLEGAISDYTEAIRLNPQSALAYYNRGSAKQEKKDLEGAIPDYTEAIRLNPQDALAYYNRGSAKQEKKDLEGAISDYTEAIRLNPQNATAYNSRGLVKKSKKDLEGAINDYTEAIRLNPQFAGAYNNRGNMKQEKKDLEGAISDYTEAIRLNPQSAFPYYNRGNAKQEKKDLAGAIEDLEKGLSIQGHPQIQELFLHLLKQQSQEQFSKKEWEGAKLNLLKLKKYLPLNDPQHKQIDQKLQQLETLLISEEKK